MRRTFIALGAAGLGVGLALGALVARYAPVAGAADHKDAPGIRQESTAADINDVYLFRSPGSATNAAMIMTVNPFVDPATNSSALFDSTVSYRFNIDRNGDAIADYIYDIRFAEPGTSTAQLITVNGVAAGTTTPTSVGPTPPAPVITSFTLDGATHTIFAGLREDPFFFDLVGTLRFLGGTGPLPRTIPVNNFAAVNTDVITLETSFNQLRGGATSGNVSIWASTHR